MATQTARAPSAAASSIGPLMRPSPNWLRAMPPGPDARVKITEAYAALVARDVYFWAWPMVNVYNRRARIFRRFRGRSTPDPSPQAPLNRLAMLTDYVAPEQRNVACPNQDVVYGMGAVGPGFHADRDPGARLRRALLGLSDCRSAHRQLRPARQDVRHRRPGSTCSPVLIGRARRPEGITKVFRSPTNTGLVAPRIAQDDTPEDKRDRAGPAPAGPDVSARGIRRDR